MNKIALAASLALTLSGPAHARLVEIVSTHSGPVAAAAPGGQARELAILQSGTSDLAEPEVLAMMLLGLCLIGHRASRDSSEIFR